MEKSGVFLSTKKTGLKKPWEVEKRTHTGGISPELKEGNKKRKVRTAGRGPQVEKLIFTARMLRLKSQEGKIDSISVSGESEEPVYGKHCGEKPFRSCLKRGREIEITLVQKGLQMKTVNLEGKKKKIGRKLNHVD